MQNWTMWVNALTFAILGATFWLNGHTARTQGRKWRYLRVVAIVMWSLSGFLLALATLLALGAFSG